VTHSRSEARLLADKLFVLEAGGVREEPVAQLAAPADGGDLAAAEVQP
jgi:ABC-type nitrate/sulfonate/bicarbonate transport system ATPase subunit